MLDKKILFLGGGNMAEGMLRGMIHTDTVAADNIYVYDVFAQRVEYLNKEYGISQVREIKDGTDIADIILLAVRPQDFNTLAKQMSECRLENKIVLSIIAGVSIEQMTQSIGDGIPVGRVMPNTMIEARCGYSGVTISDSFSDEQKEDVESLMNALGDTMFIPENLFDVFTAYSCAGPAYAYYFFAALVDAGVESGFSRQDSVKIAVESFLGAAIMVQKTGKHPYQITDTMTSPAGIGIAGLHVLSSSGFHGIIMDSVKAALDKTKNF